jgi:hypothetical protein
LSEDVVVANLDAAKPEPAPKGEGEDVGAAAAQFLRNNSLGGVASDLEARITFGEKKYGTRLKTNNGRNSLMDAYQELLDFLNYSMQGHMEGKEGHLQLFMHAMSLVARVESLLKPETPTT